MKNWIRIIERPEYDALVTKTYKEEDDTYGITFTVKYDGIEASLTTGFKEEARRDKAWEEQPDDSFAKVTDNIYSQIQ